MRNREAGAAGLKQIEICVPYIGRSLGVISDWHWYNDARESMLYFS